MQTAQKQKRGSNRYCSTRNRACSCAVIVLVSYFIWTENKVFNYSVVVSTTDSEVLSERKYIEQESQGILDRNLSLPWPIIEATRQSRKAIWIATHHKTGTQWSMVLAGQFNQNTPATLHAESCMMVSVRGSDMAAILENVGEFDLYVQTNSGIFPKCFTRGLGYKKKQGEKSLREMMQRGHPERVSFVHMVRDPLEVIISSYLYYLQEPEVEMWWLTDTSFREPLSQISLGGSTYTEIIDRIAISAGCGDKPLPLLSLLKCAPTYEGLMIAGYHAMLKTNFGMLAVKEAFCGDPMFHQINLSDVVRNLNQTMGRLLDFVGIGEGYVTGTMRKTVIDKIVGLQQRQKTAGGSHFTEGKYNKAELRSILLSSSDTAFVDLLNSVREMLPCL